MHDCLSSLRPLQRRIESVDDRIARVFDLHLHPHHGSRYWTQRIAAMGLNGRRFRSMADLDLLGQMQIDDLHSRPLLDFIPQALHAELPRLRIAQTGGTTGVGTWTAYRDDELLEAFVEPFIIAADHLGFPRRQPWLFVGPSGPHVIGKVVRHLAAAFDSAEPFMVDFDPRWARKLATGSFAARRYLRHVVEQAMAVIHTQPVGVLFTTPPVLMALEAAMTPQQRDRIAAIHYGGMALDPAQLHHFQTTAFPAAVHLSGYGNTLFGCALELSTEPGRTPAYFPYGNRLLFETVGEAGQVRFTRLDETMLIVRLLERDVAELLSPPPGAPAGFELPGLCNPHTPIAKVPAAASGLY